MNRITILFLTVLAPLLALVLAWLGWLTWKTNLLGWFLMITGLGFAAGVLVRYWILRHAYWNPRSGEKSNLEEKGDRSFWMIMPGLGAPLYLAPIEFLILPAVLPRTMLFQYVGVSLVLGGIILFGEARRKIRAFYSGHLTVTQSQALVQSGPYRSIRHPAYLGFLLMALGTALGYSSLIGLAAVALLLLPGLAYRIRVEEALLEKAFQEEWRQYASRTRRLIPGLW
jgi:protein-S-isoprenylcysteine O-methyltransferase Ste14